MSDSHIDPASHPLPPQYTAIETAMGSGTAAASYPADSKADVAASPAAAFGSSKEERESLLLLPLHQTSSPSGGNAPQSRPKWKFTWTKSLLLFIALCATILRLRPVFELHRYINPRPHPFSYSQSLSRPDQTLQSFFSHRPVRGSRAAFKDQIAAYQYLTHFTSHDHTVDKGDSNLGGSVKKVEEAFLKVPDAESAREASHSFTAQSHVAGTEGDRLSALQVKSQWEELLHLPITDDETNVFESGSQESKEALMGKHFKKHHRHCSGRGGRGKWRKATKHFSQSIKLVWGKAKNALFGRDGSNRGIKGTHHHAHTHEHTHAHTHEHTHEHNHEHTHEHNHEHTHEHTHEHAHDHDHEHTHDHTHEHAHEHTHEHTKNHDVDKQHGEHHHYHHHSGHKEEKPRVWVDTYYPLLNFPVSHSLSLTPGPNSSTPAYKAKLTEDIVKEDKTSEEGRNAVPTFHGFSKNGTAKGQLVYAGRGTKEEFLKLASEGVDFKGKIAIVQYGGLFRGLKISAAADAGCVACIIYTDPIEDGDVTEEKGYKHYPDGPARQPSSVQRGSAQFLSLYAGDPLTPFTPAYKNSTNRKERDDPTINIPIIPSLPISYEDAIPFLTSLNGKGVQLKGDGKHPEGGLGYKGVEYWTGPGEDEIELVNIVDDKVTPIWNTMAVIPGRIKDEVVILGNHNDAWTFGAGDPNSGTASVHEVVKGLGILLEQGWKPLRTIVLASWDAEEYGLIGSTEFGEDFSTWLKQNVVAYLNVDVSVSGTYYGVGASPSLADLFKSVSGEIIDPDLTNQTLLDRMASQDSEEGWAGNGDGSKEIQVGPLGSGSDFTVFLQHLGLASVNVGYSRNSKDPVYHYHSIYDSAYWMDHFGDPTFKRHEAVAKVLGLATLRLADSLILPLNVTAYAQELTYYAEKVKALAVQDVAFKGKDLHLPELDHAIRGVQKAAARLELEISQVQEVLHRHEFDSKQQPHSRSRIPPRAVREAFHHVRSINKRLAHFESGFIDDGGLPQRTWYRSLVVAPGRYLGYGATTFPAITEAITLDHDVDLAGAEVERLIKAFGTVVDGLNPRHH